jgi:hypothetical protein
LLYFFYAFHNLHKLTYVAHRHKSIVIAQGNSMLQPLWEFNDVLDALGGCSAVARLCGQQPAAVTNWRRRHGQFPCKYYLTLRCALEDCGFYPNLALFNFFRVSHLMGEKRIKQWGEPKPDAQAARRRRARYDKTP